MLVPSFFLITKLTADVLKMFFFYSLFLGTENFVGLHQCSFMNEIHLSGYNKVKVRRGILGKIILNVNVLIPRYNLALPQFSIFWIIWLTIIFNLSFSVQKDS
jgi:hypothetical protein